MAQFPPRIKNVLAKVSGNRCAFDGCKVKLVVDADQQGDSQYSIGEAAHICGENEGAQRYDPTQSDEERQSVDNGMYLCANHHSLIDKPGAEKVFTVERLREMKENHESLVNDAMEEALDSIEFDELLAVCERIELPSNEPATTDFVLTAISAKIERNKLGLPTKQFLELGLRSVSQVAEAIEECALEDQRFPFRLRRGFVGKYQELAADGQSGDMLFMTLWNHANKRAGEVTNMAASLAVLCYFFEICEVFER